MSYTNKYHITFGGNFQPADAPPQTQQTIDQVAGTTIYYDAPPDPNYVPPANPTIMYIAAGAGAFLIGLFMFKR